ncbi:MAG: lipid-A-disaccharide synthase [Gammaproteobacteria bacterium]|nr:lipid-A-disaccharide synthase [Gammaproteobacteria bacterium]
MSYFVIVAGEPSGDILGCELINALKKDNPDHRFEGIAGPEMIKAGCVPWFHVSELSVMGIFGVLRHLPRILGIRNKLLKKILDNPPDAFIGIDYPDFNLGLEKKLKKNNIKTIHMVAPSFWAWREGRVKTIKESVDLLLCLFPFEEELLKTNNINTKFIGHPLAKSIEKDIDMLSVRRDLGIQTETLIAIMPGSRKAEINQHMEVLFEAAELIERESNKNNNGDIQFIVPTVFSESEEILKHSKPKLFKKFHFTKNSTKAISASNLVITKSGTSTLQAALHKKPMIVVYRMSNATYYFLKIFNLVKTKYAALPNILFDEEIVPELIQDNFTAKNIYQESIKWLSNSQRKDQLIGKFDVMHEKLASNSTSHGAEAIMELITPIKNT